MKVLSLCDGMSCGHIALDRAGIEVEQYFAAEIKEIGIQVTKENYPDTIHIGDVNKISFKDGVLYTEHAKYDVGHIDLVIFGSPCQTFSIAIPAEQRVGLENLEKSGLFYQCNRILQEVNPTYFLMENVESMRNSDRDVISKFLGYEPIMIDAKLVGPALRKRYYWSNIPGVQQPNDEGVVLQDILKSGYTDRTKARCLAVIDSRPNTTPIKMFHRYYSTGFTTLIFKDEAHYKACVEEYQRLTGGKRKVSASELDGYTGHVFDGVRYMDQEELEKCQGVPLGYTKCLERNDAADVLGDGWNVDVVAHIFKYLKEKEKEMELKVKAPTFPEVIEFNFDELKQEITERASTYVNLVYSDEQIQDAKKDRATLNKFVKALSDERIKIKKECLKPYEDFEAKIKELDKIVNVAISNIDSQVKGYEEKKRQEKLDEITNFFNSTNHPEWLHISQIMNDKWLNASVSIKAVMGEMDSRLEQIESDLVTLANLPEFGFEATEIYKSTLDLAKAINEGQRLADMAKRKAEAERLKAEREAEQARLAAEAEAQKAEAVEPVKEAFPADAMNPPEPPKQWVSFKALLTVDQAKELKRFFDDREIEFYPI